MQPQNGQLSQGFIPVDEAIKLINKDTRNKATVDLSWMIRNIHYIQENKNFRIPLMYSDEKGYAHHKGNTYVYVADTFEKETLRHAIREAFKKRTGNDINPEKVVKNKTTVYDPENNTLGMGSAIQSNPNPQTKSGDILGKGEA